MKPDLPGALIAVCGVPEAGKSVFLTCVFRTIRQVVSPDLVVTFDRQVGGASHFETIEKEIGATGKISGTYMITLQRARLLMQTNESSRDGRRLKVAVDIADFAGGHFSGFADPVATLQNEADTKAQGVFREVDELLEEADAVVILISAVHLREALDGTGPDPFNPSVDYMIAGCLERRRPLALLLSQADRDEQFTDESFHSMPRIQELDRRFTSDLAEFRAGNRPYGVAQRVSCFSTDTGGKPLRRSTDGGFWQSEPAAIVLNLLRAALPEIRTRQARDERLRRAQQMEEEARLAEANAQRDRARRLNVVKIAFGVIALIVLLLMLRQYIEGRAADKRAELLRTAASEIDAGKYQRLGAESSALASAALADSEVPSEQPDSLRSARAALELSIVRGATALANSPALSTEHLDAVRRVIGVAGTAIEPGIADWKAHLLPLLQRRAEVLPTVLALSTSDYPARLRGLRSAHGEALSPGDRAFKALLEKAMDSTRAAEFEQWRLAVRSAGGDATKRLVVIRSKAPAIQEEPASTAIEERASILAGQVLWSVLDHNENEGMRRAVVRLLPRMGQFGETQLRFDLVARAVESCASPDECERFMNILDECTAQVVADVSARSPLMEETLRDVLQPLATVSSQRRVWLGAFRGMNDVYLFTLRADTWRKGVEPLPTRAARLIASTSATGLSTMEAVFLRIARSPIYLTELRFLSSLVRATGARRRLVAVYDAEMSQVLHGTLPPDSLRLRQIAKDLKGSGSDRWPPWDAVRWPTEAIEQEVGETLADLGAPAQSQALTSRGSVGVAALSERLQNQIRQHCRVLDPRPVTCNSYLPRQ